MVVIKHLLRAISHQSRKEKKGKWANGEKEKTKKQIIFFPFSPLPLLPLFSSRPFSFSETDCFLLVIRHDLGAESLDLPLDLVNWQ